MKRTALVWSVMFLGVLLGALAVSAQETPAPAAPVPSAPVPAASAPSEPAAPAALPRAPSQIEQLTLWNMIEHGGAIVWTLIAMSIVTGVLGVYLFLTLTPNREAPASLVKRAMAQVRAGDLRGAYQMCEGREELLAKVLCAGLKVSGHDRYVIQEAMESEGERGATALWQKISYLNNVGVIAPLLGLLGTVVGMIQAFGSIALDNSQVKGLEMAYGVAKAMITTAAGLLLAIPAMIAYFYLRGRVIKIIAQVEAQATEVIELLSRGHES